MGCNRLVGRSRSSNRRGFCVTQAEQLPQAIHQQIDRGRWVIHWFTVRRQQAIRVALLEVEQRGDAGRRRLLRRCTSTGLPPGSTSAPEQQSGRRMKATRWPSMSAISVIEPMVWPGVGTTVKRRHRRRAPRNPAACRQSAPTPAGKSGPGDCCSCSGFRVPASGRRQRGTSPARYAGPRRGCPPATARASPWP